MADRASETLAAWLTAHPGAEMSAGTATAATAAAAGPARIVFAEANDHAMVLGTAGLVVSHKLRLIA
ncbi:hypothetical protein OHU25_11895 [Streptomyces sp. NBC_00117]|uniref:hypothetical protein n=1 Tax=unclassified Streptomyces TaxID=2593676 RepID=UPI002254C5B9|nr:MULTISPECIES: hypothetical protein [unclassified Streptomyces]MCX5435651.1 hypothetical protein [Streptomyces sp. NBC_00063]WSE08819.1 hypothetical protein OG574_38920 [Streptomyces sp. NBC_01445]